MCFVDLEKAFSHLWGDYGVLDFLIQIVWSLHGVTVCNKADSVRAGLHQGWPLSMILLIIFMVWLLRGSRGLRIEFLVLGMTRFCQLHQAMIFNSNGPVPSCV